MADFSIVDFVLIAGALFGAVWALVPPVMFFLGQTRLRHDIREEPALAEPTPDDPDYERRFAQFAELGFRPAGTIVEKGWFINAQEWRYQSRVIRWLALPDGRAFASFHRLIDDEPVRFGFLTVLSDGGMVRTTCPGAGLQTMEGNWLRVEVRDVEPTELWERHQKNVELFVQRRELKVRTATFAEASAADEAYDFWAVRRSGGGHQYQIPLSFFVAPTLLAGYSGGWFGYDRTDWQTWAAAGCVGTAVYALLQLVVMPVLFRVAVNCPAMCADDETAPQR